MDLQVRQATEDDVAAISVILDHAVHAKMHHGDLNWGDKAYDPNVWPQLIAAGNVYVALLGDDVVGTFRLEWQDDGMWGVQPPVAGYVQRFAVSSAHRGQKLGRRIFDLAAQVVALNGRQYVRLTCPIDNAKLRAYHESNGFYRADAKATPFRPAYAAAYYERPVSGQAPQVAVDQAKKGLLHKLRRIHFGQSYN
jgi:GNAT superfamily N-acetyltransferase